MVVESYYEHALEVKNRLRGISFQHVNLLVKMVNIYSNGRGGRGIGFLPLLKLSDQGFENLYLAAERKPIA